MNALRVYQVGIQLSGLESAEPGSLLSAPTSTCRSILDFTTHPTPTASSLSSAANESHTEVQNVDCGPMRRPASTVSDCVSAKSDHRRPLTGSRWTWL